ncbi:hypothetical protein Ais01nite_58330 [Asanoa ishikariensis]|uniref:hypothetical protein n=1 Tax=Asanoa ishikariensis TaxID=137265 RepID=UPI00115F99A3|nr:hypothetical protein [Asanoa ishikariensis]GIF67798.1 hypothetical protein Ais01nite_58330 [Asanoa ishikariensis]
MLDHEDAGWFAKSWHQDCRLRYVEGYATSLTRDAAARGILAREDPLSSRSPLFGTAAWDRPCALFLNEKHSATVLFHGVGGDCAVPTPIGGPIITDVDRLAVKEFRSFDPARVDNRQNQIWLILDEPYSREDLGCDVSDVIFCGSPRATPVQAP